MRFFIQTFGCKINQYESESVREVWLKAGHTEEAGPDRADVVVLNSCAVTAKAVADLRHMVRKVRQANPTARIVVTGCAATALRKDLKLLPGVDRLLSGQDKTALLTWDGQGLPDAEAMTPSPDHGWDRPGFAVSAYKRARAVLKVQDGCSHRCAYCIVPLARGPRRSRDAGAALAEARRLLESGHREIIIGGINLAQYGQDLDGQPDFWSLVSHLDRALAPDWAGRARLRLSSLDPVQLDARGADTLAGARMVCPHVHLSLQSGSPDTLRRMGRGHYTPERVMDGLDRLRRCLSAFALGADILVGFPGETDALFQESHDFVASLPLSYAHVFPYSRRPGTVAATLPDQIPAEVKRIRAATMRTQAEKSRETFRRSMLQRTELSVILEDSRSPHGECEYYLQCRFRRRPEQAGRRDLVRCRPVAVGPEFIEVEPVGLTDPGCDGECK